MKNTSQRKENLVYEVKERKRELKKERRKFLCVVVLQQNKVLEKILCLHRSKLNAFER
jgi:hypothetical protein